LAVQHLKDIHNVDNYVMYESVTPTSINNYNQEYQINKAKNVYDLILQDQHTSIKRKHTDDYNIVSNL